jgi:hypothetical protein
MLTSQFLETYAGPQHPIDPTSPELAFLERLCTPGADAAALFSEMTLYGAQVYLDAPRVTLPPGRHRSLCPPLAGDFGARGATV